MTQSVFPDCSHTRVPDTEQAKARVTNCIATYFSLCRLKVPVLNLFSTDNFGINQPVINDVEKIGVTDHVIHCVHFPHWWCIAEYHFGIPKSHHATKKGCVDVGAETKLA